MTEPLGQKYFDLFQYVPLRPFENELEFVAAEDFSEVLRAKSINNALHPDELSYLEVLELLLSDYAETIDSELEDEDAYVPAIAEEVCDDVDELAAEFEKALDDHKNHLQEWDFVQLCNSCSTIISRKVSELESE